jgi:hypothetical protein
LKRVGYNEEDIDSALSSQISIENDENSFGRSRPITHVFSQGKVFTYPKLEIPKVQNSRKTVRRSAIQSTQVIDPEVIPFVPTKPTNHTILTSLLCPFVTFPKNTLNQYSSKSVKKEKNVHSWATST